jgi:predicted transcriptional regulator
MKQRSDEVDITAWRKYELAESQLKGFTRSAVRTKIMLYLKDGEKNSRDLEKEFGLRASTILHSIKEMIESDIIEKGNKGYVLTNTGKIQALLLGNLSDTIFALDTYKKFWQTHDISDIPDDLLSEIGMLSQSEILEGDMANILKTQEYWISEVTSSKEVAGVSPIIIPAYPEAIAKALQNGAKVDLILTKPILEIVLRDYGDILKTLLEMDNFTLYRIDKDVKIAYTVTDSYLSLGLFRIDGGYDVGNDLNCFGEKAIKWGKKLFEHHRRMSHLIESI